MQTENLSLTSSKWEDRFTSIHPHLLFFPRISDKTKSIIRLIGINNNRDFLIEEPSGKLAKGPISEFGWEIHPVRGTEGRFHVEKDISWDNAGLVSFSSRFPACLPHA